MTTSRLGSGPSPETRRVRFKEILVIDHWPFAIGEALEEARYRLLPRVDLNRALHSVGRRGLDLVVVSDLVGDRALEALLEELRALDVPPPTVLVASLQGLKRWEAWRALSNTSIVCSPFRMEDVLEAVRAQIGDPWEDLAGGSAG